MSIQDFNVIISLNEGESIVPVFGNIKNKYDAMCVLVNIQK